MNKVAFCPPEGAVIDNPSIDFLRGIIQAQEESYWLKGSRDAGLHFQSDQRTSQLILRFRKNYGYCVYYESGHIDLPLVLCTNPGGRSIVELKESGNSLRLPASHFVQSDAAFEAVEEFMKTGEPLPNRQWIVFSPGE